MLPEIILQAHVHDNAVHRHTGTRSSALLTEDRARVLLSEDSQNGSINEDVFAHYFWPFEIAEGRVFSITWKKAHRIIQAWRCVRQMFSVTTGFEKHHSTAIGIARIMVSSASGSGCQSHLWSHFRGTIVRRYGC